MGTHVNVLSVTTDSGTDFSFTQASCVLAVTQVILAQEMEDLHLYVPPLQGLTNMFRQEWFHGDLDVASKGYQEFMQMWTLLCAGSTGRYPALLDSERASSIGLIVPGGLKGLRVTTMLEITLEENVDRCIKEREDL